MIVYIIGHRGWIGKKMCKLFQDNKIQIVLSEFRAEDSSIFEDILDKKITHIFCCSGRTHGELDGKVYQTIDYLEDIKTTNINNIVAPYNSNVAVKLSKNLNKCRSSSALRSDAAIASIIQMNWR